MVHNTPYFSIFIPPTLSIAFVVGTFNLSDLLRVPSLLICLFVVLEKWIGSLLFSRMKYIMATRMLADCSVPPSLISDGAMDNGGEKVNGTTGSWRMECLENIVSGSVGLGNENMQVENERCIT